MMSKGGNETSDVDVAKALKQSLKARVKKLLYTTKQLPGNSRRRLAVAAARKDAIKAAYKETLQREED